MRKHLQLIRSYSTTLAAAIILMLTIPISVNAQIELPITFEDDAASASDFEQMRGSVIEIVANPEANDINDSENVGEFVKGDQQPYAGFRFEFATPFQAEEEENRVLQMKVWSPRANIEVRVELQSPNDGNQALFDTVWTSGEWVQLEFDLSDVNPAIEYTRLFQTYDWDGGPGDGTADWIWYFDDIELVEGQSVGIENNKEIPADFTLSQNYPNPFNPTTQIQFGLPFSSEISLKVFNMLGQHITTLAEGAYSEGAHSINFDATNLSSGIYIYKLSTKDGFEKTNKMTLIK
ncbi:MAG: T9SS type A sorting domain-containing protein [Balneolaceae bacterium]